jgi:hypothetical protein
MSNFAFDNLAIAKETFVKLFLSFVKIMKISNYVIDEHTVAKKVSLSNSFSGRFFILANVFLVAEYDKQLIRRILRKEGRIQV